MMSGLDFGIMSIGMLFMMGFWILPVIAIAWLAVVWARRSDGAGAVRTLTGSAAPSPVAQNPIDVLKLRYAKGEITQQQFEEFRRDLAV